MLLVLDVIFSEIQDACAHWELECHLTILTTGTWWRVQDSDIFLVISQRQLLLKDVHVCFKLRYMHDIIIYIYIPWIFTLQVTTMNSIIKRNNFAKQCTDPWDYEKVLKHEQTNLLVGFGKKVWDLGRSYSWLANVGIYFKLVLDIKCFHQFSSTVHFLNVLTILHQNREIAIGSLENSVDPPIIGITCSMNSNIGNSSREYVALVPGEPRTDCC